MKEIAFASASHLAALIRRRDIGCLELLDYFITRVERLNGRLNAVVIRDFDQARSQARKLDNITPAGPLFGVPMTIKEGIDVAGLPTSFGIPQFTNNIPKADSVAVARLKAAGAVIFGKTNVPAGLSDWQSYNQVYGSTGNPWNLSHSPGGSSGGAAAAVAAGLTGMEIGSDTGGSIRVPAHFCGIFGHKPTWGLVPLRGHSLTELAGEVDMGVIGPLARSASDLAIALNLLASPDSYDSGLRYNLPLGPTGVSGLRVALWPEDEATRTDHETAAALHALGDMLEEHGVLVNRTARPDFRTSEVYNLYVELLAAVNSGFQSDEEVAQMRAQAAALAPEDMSTKAVTLRATGMNHRTWLTLNEQRFKVRRIWSTFFSDFDVLLCPVFGRAAFRRMEDGIRWDRQIQIDDVVVAHDEQLFWSGITCGFYLPSTVAPITRSKDGLPIGVQIVARSHGDRTTIAVAALIELLNGGFVPPPGWD
ncbi:MAG TPA: amidase [Chthoniobacterales bacterium]|nr:amidase [Chthoniobacterales bacterium]